MLARQERGVCRWVGWGGELQGGWVQGLHGAGASVWVVPVAALVGCAYAWMQRRMSPNKRVNFEKYVSRRGRGEGGRGRRGEEKKGREEREEGGRGGGRSDVGCF